jgi:HlyD family secretion protein
MGKTLPWILLLCSPLLFLSGCQNSPPTQAQTASPDRPIPVDAGIAKLDSLTNTRRFTGTTKPGKEVTLRARIEGQLVSLNIDRGIG